MTSISSCFIYIERVRLAGWQGWTEEGKERERVCEWGNACVLHEREREHCTVIWYVAHVYCISSTFVCFHGCSLEAEMWPTALCPAPMRPPTLAFSRLASFSPTGTSPQTMPSPSHTQWAVFLLACWVLLCHAQGLRCEVVATGSQNDLLPDLFWIVWQKGCQLS